MKELAGGGGGDRERERQRTLNEGNREVSKVVSKSVSEEWKGDQEKMHQEWKE